MDMELVNTVHKSNKDICLRNQEVKSVWKYTTILGTSPRTMLEDLT
jgi:hypothetical protein